MHLLLLEDNDGDAELLREAAEDAGLDVEIEHVDRLAHAVERLERHAGYDAVLSDLGLPDSLGVDTVRALRDAAPTVPIIVMTGSSTGDLGVQVMRVGADDYLEKGRFDADSLSRSLRYAIERKAVAMRAEEAVRDEARIVATLQRIGELLAAKFEVGNIVQTVTDEATELTGAAFGAFFYNVFDEDGESYTLYTLSGAPRQAFEQFPMPRNTAVFDPTFQGEGVVRSDDITADPRYGHNEPYAGMPPGHLPVRSYLAVPVVSRSGKTLGGLFFGHPESGVFGEREERIAAGIAGWAALAMDNAQLYEAERHARREAEEANRTKSDFLATMSHELRTPLNAMIGYTELWQQGLPCELPEKVLPQVERVQFSAHHLLQLIDEVLTFSRLEAAQEVLELEDTSIGELIDSVVALVEPLALRKGLDFRVGKPDADVAMRTDPRKVRQILLNLLSNGVKFTDEGSVALEGRRRGESVEFTVRDSGLGIDDEDLPRVFEAFWQARRASDRPPGTGLGLAVSHRLAALLGGSLEVESEVGEGTAFTVVLPIESVEIAED